MANDPRSHSKYRRLRREVLGTPGSKPCHYCGRPATETDHVVPVSKGGRAKDKANLVPACRRCNARKGARSFFSARQTISRPPVRPHTHPYGRVGLAADYTAEPAE